MVFIAGLFAVLLIVLVVKLWPLFAIGTVIYLAWRWLLSHRRERHAREQRERRRHQRARREIDAIGRAATQAMVDAARRRVP